MPKPLFSRWSSELNPATEVSQTLGAVGSSLARLFWQMVLRVQSVTQEEQRKKRKDTLQH